MFIHHFFLGDGSFQPSEVHRIYIRVKNDEINMPNYNRERRKPGFIIMNHTSYVVPQLREYSNERVVEPHNEPGQSHNDRSPDQGPIFGFFNITEASE